MAEILGYLQWALTLFTQPATVALVLHIFQHQEKNTCNWSSIAMTVQVTDFLFSVTT